MTASEAGIWRGALVSVGVVSALPLICLVLVAAAMLPFAAGTLIYVAAVDLIPVLWRELAPSRRAAAVAMALGGAGVTMLAPLLPR